MYADNYLMYLRKSRADDPSETIEEVLKKHYEILQRYAYDKFGEYIKESNIYREVVSGETIDERPEINKILKRMESPDILGVLVVDPQRLTRGDLIDCGTIINAFKYSNTLIITPIKTFDLSFNTDGPNYDEKMLKMELGNGSEYLEYTKMIMNRGRNLSTSKGNYIGSVAPYGYKRIFIDKQPTLDFEPTESKAVILIYDLYLQGYGYNKIATTLDMRGYKPRHNKNWSSSVVKDILSNPIYTGHIAKGRKKEIRMLKDGKMIKTRPRNKNYELIKGKHPAIINKETFDAAQSKMGKNPRVNSRHKMINPLSSLLFCKTCGKAIIYREYKRKDGTIKNLPRYLCGNQKNCHTKSSRYIDIYELLIDTLDKIVVDFEFKATNDNTKYINEYNNMLKNIQKELDDIEEKQNELYDLLESKIYSRDIFVKRNDKLAIQRNEVKQRYNDLLKNSPSKTDYKEKALQFKDVINALKDEDIEAIDKNNLLKSIIKRIEYSYVDGKIILDVVLL